jgi:hypothetical protein
VTVGFFGEMGKSGDLTVQDTWSIVSRYFWHTNPSTGKLSYGGVALIASELNIGKSTIQRTMANFRELCNAQNTLAPDLSDTLKLRPGRPNSLTQELKDEIKAVNERTFGRLTILELSNRLTP